MCVIMCLVMLIFKAHTYMYIYIYIYVYIYVCVCAYVFTSPTHAKRCAAPHRTNNQTSGEPLHANNQTPRYARQRMCTCKRSCMYVQLTHVPYIMSTSTMHRDMFVMFNTSSP